MVTRYRTGLPLRPHLNPWHIRFCRQPRSFPSNTYYFLASLAAQVSASVIAPGSTVLT
ncbi:MAG: hypothetical protein PHF16_04810 [Atribacterota bacterium]|nr:hypothetical protein [Atribacterota bacterium]